jgi:hypothetical protein
VTTVPAPWIVNERSTCSSGSAGRRAAARQVRGHPIQRGRDRLDALAHARRAGDHLHLPATGHELGRLLRRKRRVGQVRLRHRDHATGHAQSREDRGVLDGLWHHAIVGGHHQQVHVHAGRPRHHRAHEALVSGHVDD